MNLCKSNTLSVVLFAKLCENLLHEMSCRKSASREYEGYTSLVPVYRLLGTEVLHLFSWEFSVLLKGTSTLAAKGSENIIITIHVHPNLLGAEAF